MKKNLFVIALFVSFSIVWGFSVPDVFPFPNDDDEIELSEIIIQPKPGPKTVVNLIRAWHNQKSCMIRLETNGQQGSVVVSIEDTTAFPVFQQIVDGNQTVVKIPLPLLTSGYYKLTIQSSTQYLGGSFEVF